MGVPKETIPPPTPPEDGPRVVYKDTPVPEPRNPLTPPEHPKYCERCGDQLALYKHTNFNTFTKKENVDYWVAICHDKARWPSLYTEHSKFKLMHDADKWVRVNEGFDEENHVRVR